MCTLNEKGRMHAAVARHPCNRTGGGDASFFAIRRMTEVVFAGQLVQKPAHRVGAVGDLAHEANLARTGSFGYRNGDHLFVRVHCNERGCILLHGSSLLSEARRRPTRRNPRWRQNVRRATLSSAGT